MPLSPAVIRKLLTTQQCQGGDWDTYLLFGPDATWTTHPGPLRDSGGPVDHQIDDLRLALDPAAGAPLSHPARPETGPISDGRTDRSLIPDHGLGW